MRRESQRPAARTDVRHGGAHLLRCATPRQTAGSNGPAVLVLGYRAGRLIPGVSLVQSLPMRSSLRALRGPCVRQTARAAIAFAALLVPASASAEDELPRWFPGLAFSFDTLQHKASRSISSSDVLGPPLGQGGCTVTVLFP